MPKVSVIVPIYHSEAYLERCCRSLMSQTLDSIEYLFIIDGPSAEARQIIERISSEYPHRQEQIQIIEHAQNLGISACRQEGHDRASGEYIYHCDSDDWLEPDALASLYRLAKEESADLVFCDYVRHYQETGESVVYSSKHVVEGEIHTIDGVLFNKIIRRQFVTEHTLKFPQGINWGEDVCMSVLLQAFAQKVSYLPQVFYHYCMHPQSQTQQIDEAKYQQLVSCPQYIAKELQLRGMINKYSLLLQQMKFEVKEYYLIHPSLRNVKKWQTIYPESHSSIWQYTSVPVYLKTISWLAANHMSWLAEFLLDCRDLIHRIRR